MIIELAFSAAAACGVGHQTAPADSARLAWAYDAWQRSGRITLLGGTGVRWTGGTWAVDSIWGGEDNVGAGAYFTQPVVDAAISLAVARCDDTLLDELAGYYAAVFARFRPFGELQAKQAPLTLGWRGDAYHGSDSTLTLPWVRAASRLIPAHPTECLLCVSQFLHPAARLIRVVAELPAADRTDQERRFVQLYTRLISSDQVLRFAYASPVDMALPSGPARGAIAGWRAQAAMAGPRRWRYPSNLDDTDLWLMAEAAELLEGHAADAGLVQLRAGEVDSLRVFVAAGVGRLRQSITMHVVGHDASGRAISGMGLFEGDYALYADDRFVGDTSQVYPAPGDSARLDSVSWDISHAIRIPAVFGSLLVSRSATGAGFPADSDVAAVINQLRYRVFNGDPSRPLFRNFFDGTDGWYRVGYSGRGQWGYPPSRYCDGQRSDRPCLGSGALAAWGLLTPSDPFLRGVADTMMALAASHDPAAIAFRSRYYATPHDPFTFETPAGARPSLVLFQLISNFADPGATAPASGR